MDDDAAYMVVVTSNAQGELTAREKGLHGLRFRSDSVNILRRYGCAHSLVVRQRYAAEVIQVTVSPNNHTSG
jgi:hypothetical protein